MDPAADRLPNLQLQSPAVDFIENCLDKYHPAFSTPPSRYNSRLGYFAIDESSNVSGMEPASAMVVAIHDGDDSPAPDAASAVAAQLMPTTEPCLHNAPRPIPQRVDALEFWDILFPRAKAQLIKAHPHEPERLVKSGWTIRDKTNWTDVFDQVEAAKNNFSKVDNKFKAGFRKVYRKFGERAAEPLNRVTKLVPAGGDMGAVAVTPIIGCVQILLEVWKVSNVDYFIELDSDIYWCLPGLTSCK